MHADIVFKNGQVITVDDQDRITEAVAVKDNRIIAVGTNDEINHMINSQTTVVNLNGKSLLPGFIDSHVHMTVYGANQLSVSCKASHIKSISDILQDLKKAALKTPKGNWIRAWGFDETNVVEKRYPTRQELDEVSTEHPIIVMRTCLHTSFVNSKALEIAGIDQNTENPEGGIIVRDDKGEPTGTLLETAHMNMFEKAKYTDEEIKKGLVLANNDFIKAGITSIHDAGGYGPESLRAMQEAVQSGEVKIRIYAKICALNNSEEFVYKVINSGIKTGLGDEKFKIGPAKVFIDGSSSVPAIATREPYTSNPEDYGILYYNQEELNEILGLAHEKGFQITAHAQGDRAIEMMLDCIEFALKRYPRKNHRHTIEHAGITMPDLLKRMKELEVIPIPNPAFSYPFGDGYLKNYGRRVHHQTPLRDFVDNGIIAAAGSDTPVADYNPLFGIHVAVNRLSKSGAEVGINQRISVLEAIRMYTLNGAYVSFEEDIKGSIEVGKLADLVVLDEQILNIEKHKIKDIQVVMTMIDGEIVYEQK